MRVGRRGEEVERDEREEGKRGMKGRRGDQGREEKSIRLDSDWEGGWQVLASVGRVWADESGGGVGKHDPAETSRSESQCSQRPHGTRALPRTPPFTCPRPRNHAVAIARSTVHRRLSG